MLLSMPANSIDGRQGVGTIPAQRFLAVGGVSAFAAARILRRSFGTTSSFAALALAYRGLCAA
jgi:hypothetical protein